jgi:sulfatase maturation enzyme AslB (radical SAM superfamily)
MSTHDAKGSGNGGAPAAPRLHFGPGQVPCIRRIVATVAHEMAVAESQVREDRATMRLAACGTVIALEPAAPGMPCFFTAGGVAVHYQGQDMNPELRRALAIAHRLLKGLPDDARPVPAPPGSGPAPRADEGPGQGPDGDDPHARRGPAKPSGTLQPLSMMAVNGALDVLPHDPEVRRVVELLWKPCPTIKLGHACNVDCAYCCAGDDGLRFESEESLRGLVDALRARGFPGIGFMGGEPTVHPGLLGLLRYAKSVGFSSEVLVTNGVRLCDRDFAAAIVEAGVDVVIMSLDTFDAGVQERLLGGPAVFAKIRAGLDNVLSLPGVDVVLAAVVTALNADLLPAYMEEVAALQRRFGKRIGVLLHALQKPAKDGPAQQVLHMPLPEAARRVGLALARAREVGVTALAFSIPPCLMEGHEQNVVELYTSEWDIDLSTGAIVQSQRRGVATWWAACGTCRHVGHCPGVLTQYADDEMRAFVASRAGPQNSARKGLEPAP